MAYFVQKNTRFMLEVYRALQIHFDERADVKYEDGNVVVKIKSGFDRQVDRLTDEQLRSGVLGGGIKQEINDEEFCLRLT